MWETGEPGVFVPMYQKERISDTSLSNLCGTYHLPYRIIHENLQKVSPELETLLEPTVNLSSPCYVLLYAFWELSSTTEKGRRYYLLLCMKGSAHLRNSHTVLL
jgi:hypothetical protein